jgi:hypothetical protein
MLAADSGSEEVVKELEATYPIPLINVPARLLAIIAESLDGGQPGTRGPEHLEAL